MRLLDLVASIIAGLGSAAHLLILPFDAVWLWLEAAATGISHGFDSMWQGIEGFFDNVLSTLAGAVHGLVLPFEAFWRWLQTAADGISSGFEGLWQNIQSFFANFLATLAGSAHELVHPFEALWKWLQAAVADAETGISLGFDGLWQHIGVFFASFLSTLSDAAHELVPQFEAFWKWLNTVAADAAGGISFSLEGLWLIVRRIYANLLAAVASAAHDVVPRLEALWRWLRAGAATALPVVLVIVAVVCVAALVWFSLPFLCSGAVPIGQALVNAVGYCSSFLHSTAVLIGQALVKVVCFCGHCLHFVAMGVGKALACVCPACGKCFAFAGVTMRAPGATGMVVSRAAFESLTQLYFLILHSAGPVVATAVFRSSSIASACAGPIAALFRR